MNRYILDVINNGSPKKIYNSDLRYYFRFLFVSPGVNNPYHNLNHAIYVLGRVYEAAIYSRLKRVMVRPLLIAAMFHDFAHSGRAGNDDKEIATAIYYLNELLLAEDRKYLSEIQDLIAATRWPYSKINLPQTALILRDADLSQILSDDWFNICVIGLSQEMGLKPSEGLKGTIKFLRDLQFKSIWGQQVLQSKVISRLHEAQYLENFIC